MAAGMAARAVAQNLHPDPQAADRAAGPDRDEAAPSSNKATAPNPFQIRINHANMQACEVFLFKQPQIVYKQVPASKEPHGTLKAYRVNENPLQTRMTVHSSS